MHHVMLIESLKIYKAEWSVLRITLFEVKLKKSKGMILGKFRIVSIAGSRGEECTRIGNAFVKLGHECVRVHYSLSCTCKLLHFIMYFTIINPKNTQRRKIKTIETCILSLQEAHFEKIKSIHNYNMLFMNMSICTKNKKQIRMVGREGHTRGLSYIWHIMFLK